MIDTRNCVRSARRRDAAAIAALYAQLVDDARIAVLPERIAAVSRDPNTALLVWESGGVVRGTALLTFCLDVMYQAQPFAVVENVVVDAAARGRGVGAALFRHIEALCAARDCSKIMLLSGAGRVQAHRFFARAGFAADAKRGFVKYRRDFAG